MRSWKIDIRGYVIRMEVRLSRDLKSRPFVVVDIRSNFLNAGHMRSMKRQITMFQASTMLLNF